MLFFLVREGMTDFPVEAAGVGEAAEAPAVFFTDGKNFGRTCLESTGEDNIGIGDGQNHPD